MHSFPIRVYWEDTDAGGIVFYANYCKYFERGRTEWLRALGFSQAQLKSRHQAMFVVSQMNLSFLRPAQLDDMLHVHTILERCGQSGVYLAQTILRADDATAPGPTLCSAKVRIAWVDSQTLRPTRIPAALLQGLQSALP